MLRDLRHIDENDMIRFKGKIASGLNHMELLVTEMLLENMLGPMSPPTIAAALSCTTCTVAQEKGDAKKLNKILHCIQ